MAGEKVKIKRIFDAGDLEKGSFEFPGYESIKRYLAKKNQSKKKIVISLELVKLKAPYVKNWAQDPSYAERRREIIAKGLS